MATAQKNPNINPIVQALEAKGASKLVKMMAFIGETKDGRVRLYPRLGGDIWMDVPVADILHVQDAETPVEPSVVFVSGDAKLEMRVSIGADQVRGLGGTDCQCGSSKTTARAVHLVDGSTGLELDPAFGIFFDPLWYWEHPELAVPRIPIRPPWQGGGSTTECDLSTALCFGRCAALTDEDERKRCWRGCTNTLMECLGLGGRPTPYIRAWR